jgi:hypothetical protein
LYDKAEIEFGAYFSLTKKPAHHLIIELIKVLIAQGNFLIAKREINKLIVDYFPSEYDPNKLDVLEVIKKDKCLGLLREISDINIQKLYNCGIYPESHLQIYKFSEDGLLAIDSKYMPLESRHGRSNNEDSIIKKLEEKLEQDDLKKIEDDSRVEISFKIKSSTTQTRMQLQAFDNFIKNFK